jgi:hypothetical protein
MRKTRVKVLLKKNSECVLTHFFVEIQRLCIPTGQILIESFIEFEPYMQSYTSLEARHPKATKRQHSMFFFFQLTFVSSASNSLRST